MGSVNAGGKVNFIGRYWAQREFPSSSLKFTLGVISTRTSQEFRSLTCYEYTTCEYPGPLKVKGEEQVFLSRVTCVKFMCVYRSWWESYIWKLLTVSNRFDKLALSKYNSVLVVYILLEPPVILTSLDILQGL